VINLHRQQAKAFSFLDTHAKKEVALASRGLTHLTDLPVWASLLTWFEAMDRFMDHTGLYNVVFASRMW
jgi:hypothetical protein